MALKMTVTPSTNYIEDSINVKITGGTIPRTAVLFIFLATTPPSPTSGGYVMEVTNLKTDNNITIDSNTLARIYSDSDWENTAKTYVNFDLEDIDGGQQGVYTPIATAITKIMYIKPELPTFNVTPTYEDINSDSLALTNNNQMIVNGLSTIRISNLTGAVNKNGTLKSIKINNLLYDYNTIINGTGYIDLDLTTNTLDKKLVLTLIDSRGWSNSYELANISKFKYIWQTPKINNYTVEHDGISETTSLTANGVYSEGYQLGTTTVEANYSYKENVEGSTETSGASTLNITKNQTYDYNNFLAILDEYENPHYIETQVLNPNGITFRTINYYGGNKWNDGINNLFSTAIMYNDKYTQEYLEADYDSSGDKYYCKSGGYDGYWQNFWKDTLELIYDKIVENGGNYEWSIEESAIQGDLQSGFSIDKTFFVNLFVENTISSASKNVQSQVLLPTAIPAIDIYKDNVSIHGLYDENLGGTQINGDLFLNGEGLFEQNILWQGGFYMRDIHTITLSKNISDTKHGIVLVWSGYDNSVSDSNFFTYYIPKEMVALHNGVGYFMSMGGTEGIVCYKYLYVGNNSITGHANNVGTHSQGGLTYNNSRAVLRYVIEI